MKKDREWPYKWMKLYSRSTKFKGGRGTRARGGEIKLKGSMLSLESYIYLDIAQG